PQRPCSALRDARSVPQDLLDNARSSLADARRFVPTASDQTPLDNLALMPIPTRSTAPALPERESVSYFAQSAFRVSQTAQSAEKGFALTCCGDRWRGACSRQPRSWLIR